MRICGVYMCGLVLVVECVVMCMHATHICAYVNWVCKCGILLLEDVAFVTESEVLVDDDGVGDEDGIIVNIETVDDENGVDEVGTI